MADYENKDREEVFSKAVRAGKRTYFFDVKATRADDYYLSITESKRKFNEDGSPTYVKHKIYLYREDFEKFVDGLKEAIDFIKREKPAPPPSASSSSESPNVDSSFTVSNFEDLDKPE